MQAKLGYNWTNGVAVKCMMECKMMISLWKLTYQDKVWSKSRSRFKNSGDLMFWGFWMRIEEKMLHLYIGFVALSLNHKTRKTSAWQKKNRNTQIHKYTNAITNTKIEIQKKLPSQRWNGHRRATRLSSPAGWSRARSELKFLHFFVA